MRRVTMLTFPQIDSAFPLTEHLKALHYSHTHLEDTDTIAPISTEIARQLAIPPDNTSKEIWLYELGRFLIQKTNAIIVALFADQPPCSSHTCPEMRASEWQYLCAVHDPPKSCSAIDYCCHTLDWAANTLTSSKMFPSRLDLGSGKMGIPNDKVLQQQMKEITNIFRRVYRIYAHAWFQHREMFWRVESRTGLYVLFKTVCDEYGMIQPENYTIPPEAEGLEPEVTAEEPALQQAPSILKRDPESSKESSPQDLTKQPEPAGNTVVASGDTTKRHRHTMSDRVSSVTTVIQEEAEEEDTPAQMPTIEHEPVLPHDDSVAAQVENDAAPTELPEQSEALQRSDTITPEVEPHQLPQAEEGEAEITVVEVEADPPAVAVLDSSPADISAESNEPEPAAETAGTEAAADGEAAGVSVAD